MLLAGPAFQSQYNNFEIWSRINLWRLKRREVQVLTVTLTIGDQYITTIGQSGQNIGMFRILTVFGGFPIVMMYWSYIVPLIMLLFSQPNLHNLRATAIAALFVVVEYFVPFRVRELVPTQIFGDSVCRVALMIFWSIIIEAWSLKTRSGDKQIPLSHASDIRNLNSLSRVGLMVLLHFLIVTSLRCSVLPYGCRQDKV